jgi:hypothetical protein
MKGRVFTLGLAVLAGCPGSCYRLEGDTQRLRVRAKQAVTPYPSVCWMGRQAPVCLRYCEADSDCTEPATKCVCESEGCSFTSVFDLIPSEVTNVCVPDFEALLGPDGGFSARLLP